MANFKVGDICVIKNGGIWSNFSGEIVEIIYIKERVCNIKFLDKKTGLIFLKELELASKLHKVLM